MKKILELIFLTWLSLLLLLMVFSRDANNFTIIAATAVSAATTFLIWSNKNYLTEKIGKWHASEKTKFILVGSAGALWVEFLYWFFEKLFGGQGLAVSTNLFYDWLATMPWYVLMVFILWQVVKKYNYSVKEILFFGGVYQVGADGFLNSVLNSNFPQQFFIGLAAFPVFVVTYSAIILPAFILSRKNNLPQKSFIKRYSYALLPLLGLVPYYIFIKILF